MIKGRTIVEVRHMTQEEVETEGWERPALALVLDDGTVIYPSQDDEGNGPGTLFGTTPTGQIYVQEEK